MKIDEMPKERIEDLIVLAFRASGYPLDLEESLNLEREICTFISDDKVYIDVKGNRLRIDINCYTPKEKGYQNMVDQFRAFQTAIEKRFCIKNRKQEGTDCYRVKIFISEPLNLEYDKEYELFIMQTELTFSEIEYEYERK